MPAFAKHSYLINEIAFLQNCMVFALQKYCTSKWNNMKVFTLIASVLILTATVCSKKNTEAGWSSCIQQKIDSIKKQPRWNPPATVNEYIYKGKTVYLFSSNCCDQYNIVYNNQCNYICAPSGGYTGKGDFKCEDFNASAMHVRLVWKDER